MSACHRLASPHAVGTIIPHLPFSVGHPGASTALGALPTLSFICTITFKMHAIISTLQMKKLRLRLRSKLKFTEPACTLQHVDGDGA